MSTDHPDTDNLDELAEEFIERYRKGERPSIAEYERRCPEHAEEIRDLFPALVVMEQAASEDHEPLGMKQSPGSKNRSIQSIRTRLATTESFVKSAEAEWGLLRSRAVVTGPLRCLEITAQATHARPARTTAIRARGKGSGKTPSHKHRAGIWCWSTKRVALLRNAIHPWSRSG